MAKAALSKAGYQFAHDPEGLHSLPIFFECIRRRPPVQDKGHEPDRKVEAVLNGHIERTPKARIHLKEVSMIFFDFADEVQMADSGPPKFLGNFARIVCQ